MQDTNGMGFFASFKGAQNDVPASVRQLGKATVPPQNDAKPCHCERSAAIAKPSRHVAPTSRHPAPDAGSVNVGKKSGFFARLAQNDGKSKVAFTLAEVLITLGVIGIVAAVTLPTVINNMQARIRSEQIRTAKYKFTLATDKMNSLGLIGPYDSTEAFVKELQKHLKLAKVCPPGKLEGCWPTKEVKIDNDGKMFEISKAITGKQFKMEENEKSDYTSNNVGIVTADGVPMIISYNKKCEPLDPVKQYAWTTEDNKPVSNATAGCVAAVLDINGSKKPNKLSEDVVLFNAKGLGSGCGFELNGKCFSAPIASNSPLSLDECYEKKAKLGIKECIANDYWGGAVKVCGGTSKMATMDDLAAIASAIYGTTVPPLGNSDSGLSYNTTIASKFGLPDPGNGVIGVWSGREAFTVGNDGISLGRIFYKDHTTRADYTRRYGSPLTICIIE